MNGQECINTTYIVKNRGERQQNDGEEEEEEGGLRIARNASVEQMKLDEGEREKKVGGAEQRPERERERESAWQHQSYSSQTDCIRQAMMHDTVTGKATGNDT